MEVLIGVGPEAPPDDALALGALIARLLDASVTVACIHPPGLDYPSHGAVDAEWVAYQSQRAQAALDAAVALLHDRWGFDAAGHLHPHRRESRGLLEVATERGSAILVLGSGRDGAIGEIVLGSTVNAVMHSSHVPVAVAPGGYALEAPSALHRLVVGYRGTPDSRAAADAAVAAAGRLGLPVHLVTLAVVPTRVAGSRLGPDAERPVIEAVLEAAAELQRDYQGVHPEVEASMVEGRSVAAALSDFAWQAGDVLVLGSSEGGLLRRVFLGDMTQRILRAAPVPVLVVPRDHVDGE